MIEAWMIIIGSVVHELYGWTGDQLIVGLFVPINESLWEHFKLGYAALLLWMPIERRVLHATGNTYAFARGLGLIALNVVVVAIFLFIRPLVPDGATLVVDIGSYVVGSIVFGQVVRRWSDLHSQLLHKLGAPLIIAIGVLFAVLTVWRPNNILFLEGVW